MIGDIHYQYFRRYKNSPDKKSPPWLYLPQVSNVNIDDLPMVDYVRCPFEIRYHYLEVTGYTPQDVRALHHRDSNRAS